MNKFQQNNKRTVEEKTLQNQSDEKINKEMKWGKNNRETFIKKEPTVLQKAFGMCAP